MIDNIRDDGTVLYEDGAVHVPMLAMDAMQRSVAAEAATRTAEAAKRSENTDAAVAATKAAMQRDTRSEASQHKPGYRLSTKLLHDSAARDALADVYGEYQDTLTNAWRNAPPLAVGDAAPADVQDAYRLYDEQIAQAYKGKSNG